MKIFLIAVVVSAAVFAALLLIPVKLEIDYKKDAVTNKAEVYLKYLCFKFRLHGGAEKTKKTAESGRTDEKTAESVHNPEKKPFSFEEQKRKLENGMRIFKTLRGDAGEILDYAARRAVVFDIVDIDSEFGFDDAMHTGIFTGIFNGFVYSVLGFVHNRSNLKNMKVNLQPVFGKICFDLHVRCILRLKNVHIMVIAYNVLKLLRKLKKAERSK